MVRMVFGQFPLLKAGFKTFQIMVQHLVFVKIFHDHLDEVRHFLLYAIKDPLIRLSGIHNAGILQVQEVP